MALVDVAVAVDVELGRVIVVIIDVGCDIVNVGRIVVVVIDVRCVIVNVGLVDDDDVSSHVDDVGGALMTWMVCRRCGRC